MHRGGWTTAAVDLVGELSQFFPKANRQRDHDGRENEKEDIVSGHGCL